MFSRRISHLILNLKTFRIGFLLRCDVWQEDFTLRQRWLSWARVRCSGVMGRYQIWKMMMTLMILMPMTWALMRANPVSGSRLTTGDKNIMKRGRGGLRPPSTGGNQICSSFLESKDKWPSYSSCVVLPKDNGNQSKKGHGKGDRDGDNLMKREFRPKRPVCAKLQDTLTIGKENDAAGGSRQKKW